MKMLCVLASGLALWIAYGALKSDFVIIGANIIGFSLVAIGVGNPAPTA
jgi:MtN3 and saliva related transmembrane protein